jgi:hypothetical protein
VPTSPYSPRLIQLAVLAVTVRLEAAPSTADVNIRCFLVRNVESNAEYVSAKQMHVTKDKAERTVV